MIDKPIAIIAKDAPDKSIRTLYPEPFASRVQGRRKQPLGDLFGLTNYGVNLLRLMPGAFSSLLHRHGKQDEFVYVLEGNVTLITDGGERELEVGMAAGFAAGGSAHHLHNRSDAECVLLEVGDRLAGDSVEYPDDDIRAVQRADGSWHFTRKDGTEFE